MTFKIYDRPDEPSRGVERVYNAFRQYSPDDIEFVYEPKQADMQIIHINGRIDRVTRQIESAQKVGRRIALIQYVLKSSKTPDPNDWLPLWKEADLVWSYYDLRIPDEKFNFYHAPLGADRSTFRVSPFRDRDSQHKEFMIWTSSKHALSESVRECAFAVKKVRAKMLFIGHELRRGEDIVCRKDLTDEQLADSYNQCTYVSGLRRTEGFELPVVEGALCGAIPIVFDRPEMRFWFNDFAIFIPEGDRESVITNLANIFADVDPFMFQITNEHKQFIRSRFDWDHIIKNFWKGIS